MSPVDRLEEVIERSRVLFSPVLNRADLLSLQSPSTARVCRLHVIRNHAVEHAATALNAFFSPWRVRIEVTFSAYDDSLSFHDTPTDCPILVWLDFSRFNAGLESPDFLDWFTNRLTVLRHLTPQPIVVVGPVIAQSSSLTEGAVRIQLAGISDFHLCGLADLASQLGRDQVFDFRAARFSGTPYSSSFLLAATRQLSCSTLARVFGVGIKAIVCDLDQTLYAGVIGEDGPSGVVLTREHEALQRRLRALREKGVILAILSRNDAEDVDELFRQRTDFPLSRADFAVVEASWSPKSVGMSRILEVLRISADAVIFLDDNPGELADVFETVPQVHLVAANEPTRALQAITWFPGIERFAEGDAPSAEVRTRDLQANVQRATLIALPDEEYLRALQMVVDIRLNDPSHIERAAELFSKTNQFNPSLARVPLVRVSELCARQDGFVVTIGLHDRLSESGIIAAWCGRILGDELMTEDLVVSCRALGRRVESIILGAMFHFVMGALGTRSICVPWMKGPRNEPALNWLKTATGGELASSPVTMSPPPLPFAARFITFNYYNHEKRD